MELYYVKDIHCPHCAKRTLYTDGNEDYDAGDTYFCSTCFKEFSSTNVWSKEKVNNYIKEQLIKINKSEGN